MFARLGPWCHDRRRLVLGIWIVLLVLIGVIAGAVGLCEPRRVQPSERRVASRLRHPRRSSSAAKARGRSARSCSAPSRGSTDPEVQQPDGGVLRRGRSDPRRRASREPIRRQADRRRSRCKGPRPERSRSPTSSCPTTSRSPGRRRSATRSTRLAPQIDGVQIELGGQIFAAFEPPSSEVLGLAFAIIILIVAFGSVLAMGLPVGVALFGIGIGVSIITLLTQRAWPCPDFTTFLGIMIGLGVGIDYALLIVTRYREQLHVGPRRARVDRRRHRHRRALRALRGHHRRHLAARACS